MKRNEIMHYGLDTPNDPRYAFDFPQGLGACLLMCFSTPFFVRTIKGIEFGQPGDCVLIDPDFPQYHGTPEGRAEGFRNDWIIFNEKSIEATAERYQVPFNTLIPTGSPRLLEPYLRAIGDEISMRRPYWEEQTRLLLETMLLQVGRHRCVAEELSRHTPAERALRDKFAAARATIHARFDGDWDVKRMAGLVNLSPERFWVLYRKFFRTSPKDDLNSKRLDEARSRLLGSVLSVEDIARQCGFNSPYYFSRWFKERTGHTPSEYRNGRR